GRSKKTTLSASRQDATKPPSICATKKSNSATIDTAMTLPPSSFITRPNAWAPLDSSTPSPTAWRAERNSHDPLLLRPHPESLRPPRTRALAATARNPRHPQGPLPAGRTLPRARRPRLRQVRHQAIPATTPRQSAPRRHRRPHAAHVH